MTKLDFNEKDNKFQDIDIQEIRKRKKPISHDHQSSSFTKNNNVKIDKKPWHKFHNSTKIICTISLIILIWFVSRNVKLPSSIFQNLADTTNNMFEEINSVELPAPNTIMEHTVACRRVANIIQRSPAFESHGIQIARGLREFGDKIREAGHSLQKMYSKGTSVYKSFNIEIEAMMHRLDSNSNYLQKGETKYFKNRLNILITIIKDFRRLVEKTYSSIHIAENIRHDTEGYILDGLREAEKYIIDSNNNHNYHPVDISRAKKELGTVNNILDHLNNTANHLDKLEKILKDYQDKLVDISVELDNISKYDDIFEVTKTDLNYLRLAVENSKAGIYKFNRKTQNF
ncbi:hypothetical protein C1645_739408 [Glomus cerebriforme]|uniref:Uncharacterized protein n=1 Tax=Glomus cerebriforme TaxID=658196 RepID=A0A397SWQ1_9GLOM|nr:hypothetical protein C1645_739408 [Glomus cerebriforme]